MRILLTGKNGQLGRCFQDAAVGSEHDVLGFDLDELDISNSDQVSNIINKAQPDIIVNAAAYTAVDQAESELNVAYAVNESGVRLLAEQAAKLDIPMIHVSTDYVFDGRAVTPYAPSSPTAPESVYGASKLAGEQALAESWEKHVILRTAWVFSEYGNNFVKTMVRLAKQRDAISVVADQYGCPTYAGDLAHAILNLCNEYQTEKELAWGLYHYCGDSPTSWHGFARTIFSFAHEVGLISRLPELTAIGSKQYPTPAKRPEYSVLDMTSLQMLSLSPSRWIPSLKQVLVRLQEENMQREV